MHKLYASWYQLKEKSNYFTANNIARAKTWSQIQLILWDQIPVNRILGCWSFWFDSHLPPQNQTAYTKHAEWVWDSICLLVTIE